MREAKRWFPVHVKLDKSTGKWTKKPAIEWSNRDNWKKYAELEGEQALGFALGDGFFGIDLDKCLDESGGVKPERKELVNDVLDLCPSFVETSISGKGLHIYGYGKMPAASKDATPGLEMYSEKRFFLVTGRPYDVNNLRPLKNIQEGIEKLYTKYATKARTNAPTNGKAQMVGEGHRSNTIFARSSVLYKLGYSTKSVVAAMLEWNRERCTPPLPDATVVKQCEDRYPTERFPIEETEEQKTEILTYEQVVETAATNLIAFCESKRFVATGFADLDATLGRLPPGSMTIIGGETASGKSHMVHAMAFNAARDGNRPGIISLEDGIDEWGTRGIALLTGCTYQAVLEARSFDPVDREDLYQQIRKAPRLAREVDVRVGFAISANMETVMQTAKSLIVDHERNVLFVDYAQAVRVGLDKKRIDKAYADVAQRLKGLCAKHKIPLVLNSQLSRGKDTPSINSLKECVTGDQLVMDADTGDLVSVRDLTEESGHVVYALNNQLKVTPARVARAWSTGVKLVFRLRTKSGRTIRATGNHPLRLLSGWRPLSKLRIGERIAVPRVLPEPKWTHDTLSDEQLRMLGYLISDGHYGKHHTVSFTTDDEFVEADVKAIAPLFGVTAKPTKCRGVARQYNLSGDGGTNGIGKWFREMGIHGDTGKNKKAPLEMFRHSNRAIGIFLGALWAGDGSVYPRKNGGWSLKYTSISPVLLNQVQWLLTRLGIVSIREQATFRGRTSVWRGRRITAQNPIASILITDGPTISRFAKMVTIPGKKGARLSEAVRAVTAMKENSRVDRLPIDVTDLVTQECVASGVPYVYMRARLGYKPQNKEMSRTDLGRFADTIGHMEFAKIAGSDILWDEIIDIEPDGEEEVFDLSVRGLNNFVVSNIFAHNSGDLENEAEIVVLLWRERNRAQPQTLWKLGKAKWTGDRPGGYVRFGVGGSIVELVKDTLPGEDQDELE